MFRIRVLRDNCMDTAVDPRRAAACAWWSSGAHDGRVRPSAGKALAVGGITA
jgi:hypothetical protein